VPEGDTVWLTAKILNDALAGQALTSTDFRVPQLATADLSGRTVREVIPRGKHILMRVDGELSMHSHLRMDGSWKVGRGRVPRGGPPHSIRVLLRTSNIVAVGYRVHDVSIVQTAAEDSLVGHLGPDLLGPDWDADEAVQGGGAVPLWGPAMDARR
jgi:endonuclease-8